MDQFINNPALITVKREEIRKKLKKIDQNQQFATKREEALLQIQTSRQLCYAIRKLIGAQYQQDSEQNLLQDIDEWIVKGQVNDETLNQILKFNKLKPQIVDLLLQIANEEAYGNTNQLARIQEYVQAQLLILIFADKLIDLSLLGRLVQLQQLTKQNQNKNAAVMFETFISLFCKYTNCLYMIMVMEQYLNEIPYLIGSLEWACFNTLQNEDYTLLDFLANNTNKYVAGKLAMIQLILKYTNTTEVVKALLGRGLEALLTLHESKYSIEVFQIKQLLKQQQIHNIELLNAKYTIITDEESDVIIEISI